MKKSTLGGASGVRYICSPTPESDADNGESRVEVDDALVGADQTESGLVLGRDTGGLESDMTEVRPSPSRWSRTEELRLALHDLSPVKDLVSRISKSRGAQPPPPATETSSAALSSAPGSRGSPQHCSPVSATADTDRRTLINKMTTKISRAVGDKLNDLRSDRSQSRYCQSSAFPPLAESISEEDVLQALSQTADSEERARQSDEDVVSTTADELLVAPDVGFRSVATPIVTAADSASVTPATGSARRDFSLSGIRPLITSRLQRRTRSTPFSTPSSPSIPSSPSAPAASSQFAISLSALQSKYGAGGQKVEGGQTGEQDEPAEEALSLLDPRQLQLHYQQRQQQLVHSGTVSSPPAAAASGGAAVSCFWARLKRWLQASVRWWRCWWLVAVVAVLVAAPLGDLWRGLWLGTVMATVGSWTLFVQLGLGGRQRAQCHCALPPRAPDPPPPLSVYTAAVGCKGWMHELVSGPYSYHAAHHKTAPVYVCIENDLLRIKTFKGHLSRRAVWKECLPSVPFGEQRIFDISGAAIELLPHHLHVSKKWSRRYPLCVRLPQPTAKLGSRVSLVPTVSAGPSDGNSAGVSAEDKFTAARGQTAEVKLYLFARTDRDKEDWFRCLSAAAKTPSPLISPSPSPVALDADNAPTPAPTPSRPALDFDCYMMHLMPSTNQVVDASHVSWFNALIGRLAFDLIGDKGVCSFVQRLVQKKLSRVKLPYFIDELRVLSCELGCAAPRLSAVERVYCDERGLWLQLPMQYAGGASVTLVSRLNLLRLTQLDQQQPALAGAELSGDRPATAGTDSGAQLDAATTTTTASATASATTTASSRHCRRHDPSDLDTSDSSSDEDSVSSCHHPGVGEQSEESQDGSDAPSAQVGSRLLRVVDRVTSSRYFKQAAQISYVKKAMVDVSNTPIELSVHLLQLNGTLCINVPRPPADRLWYGFLHEPCIQISAQPRYGTRDVTTGHVTERIESSLVHELKKLLTLPNMDDLLLSYLHTDTGT